MGCSPHIRDISTIGPLSVIIGHDENKETILISRRSFLKRCALTGAAAGLPAWFIERDLAEAAPSRILGPNERPAIALVGCGGMGRGDASNARRFGEIVAVCDVDAGHAAAAAQQFTAGGKRPAVFNDVRKVMERDDIQIILNAHARPLAHAGQYGGGQGGQGRLW